MSMIKFSSGIWVVYDDYKQAIEKDRPSDLPQFSFY